RRRRWAAHRLPHLVAGARAAANGRLAGAATAEARRLVCPGPGGIRPRLADRIPAPGRSRTAALLERRRGVLGMGEAAAALAAPQTLASRAHVVECHRADPRAIPRARLGSVPAVVDELCRSAFAPPRAAAHARRQDDDGRGARRTCAVSRSSAR